MNTVNYNNKVDNPYLLEQKLLEEFPHYRKFLESTGFSGFGLPTFVLHGLVSYFRRCLLLGDHSTITNILSWISQAYIQGAIDEKSIIGAGILEDFLYDESLKKELLLFAPNEFNKILSSL